MNAVVIVCLFIFFFEKASNNTAVIHRLASLPCVLYCGHSLGLVQLGLDNHGSLQSCPVPGIPVVKLRAVWDPHRDGTAQHLPYHTVRDHTVCYRTSESSHSLILSGLSSFFSLSLFFLSFLFPSSSSFLFSPPLPNVYDSLLVTMSSSILSSPSRFPSITGVTGNT